MGFPARYEGTCLKCRQAVLKSHFITWSRTPGNKGVYHVYCNNVLGTGLAGSGKGIPEDKPIPEAEPEKDPSPWFPVPAVEPPKQIEHKPEAKPEPKPMGGNTMKDGFLEMIAQAVSLTVKDDIIAGLPKSEQGLNEEQARGIVQDVVRIALEETFPAVVRFESQGKVKHIKGTHVRFKDLLYYVSRKKHCYLFGPHGTGKSTAAQQVSEALELPYGYISLTPQTPESRLVGYMNATGGYVRTPFRDCYENGGIFCIDELDNMSQALATTLNGALENGHTAFPDGLIERHENFTMVGTGNTSGAGANPSYPDRRPFDKAFRDRFIYLQWGHDTKLERAIALSLWKDADPWVDWVLSVRRWAEKNYTKLVPSPRITFRLAEFLGDNRPVKETLSAVLWQGDTEAESKILANCPLPESEAKAA